MNLKIDSVEVDGSMRCRARQCKGRSRCLLPVGLGLGITLDDA